MLTEPKTRQKDQGHTLMLAIMCRSQLYTHNQYLEISPMNYLQMVYTENSTVYLRENAKVCMKENITFTG